MLALRLACTSPHSNPDPAYPCMPDGLRQAVSAGLRRPTSKADAACPACPMRDPANVPRGSGISHASDSDSGCLRPPKPGLRDGCSVERHRINGDDDDDDRPTASCASELRHRVRDSTAESDGGALHPGVGQGESKRGINHERLVTLRPIRRGCDSAMERARKAGCMRREWDFAVTRAYTGQRRWRRIIATTPAIRRGMTGKHRNACPPNPNDPSAPLR